MPRAPFERAVAILAVSLFAVGSAKADMRVLESSVPDYAVGAVLPDSPSLKLPPGGRVKVLLLPSNATKVFEGADAASRSQPWSGTRRPELPKKD